MTAVVLAVEWLFSSDGVERRGRHDDAVFTSDTSPSSGRRHHDREVVAVLRPATTPSEAGDHAGGLGTASLSRRAVGLGAERHGGARPGQGVGHHDTEPVRIRGPRVGDRDGVRERRRRSRTRIGLRRSSRWRGPPRVTVVSWIATLLAGTRSGVVAVTDATSVMTAATVVRDDHRDRRGGTGGQPAKGARHDPGEREQLPGSGPPTRSS